MDMDQNKKFSIIIFGLVMLALTVCALFFAEDVTKRKIIRLGTSSYYASVPMSFKEEEITDEERSRGQVKYYKSDVTLLDFDVFQISKNANDNTNNKSRSLEDFLKFDTRNLNCTEIITDGRINGIKYASYRAIQEYDGKNFKTMTYIFDDKTEFLKLLLWLDGDTAEPEARLIINSLSKR